MCVFSFKCGNLTCMCVYIKKSTTVVFVVFFESKRVVQTDQREIRS